MPKAQNRKKTVADLENYALGLRKKTFTTIDVARSLGISTRSAGALLACRNRNGSTSRIVEIGHGLWEVSAQPGQTVHSNFPARRAPRKSPAQTTPAAQTTPTPGTPDRSALIEQVAAGIRAFVQLVAA